MYSVLDDDELKIYWWKPTDFLHNKLRKYQDVLGLERALLVELHEEKDCEVRSTMLHWLASEG